MSRPAGLILAGGRGSRMGPGASKPLRMLGSAPLLAHVVERLRPQVSALFLNAPAEGPFAAFDLPMVPDVRPGFAGPLAGIEAGLSRLASEDPDGFLLVAPADTPFLPANLAERLAAPGAGRPVIASSAGRLHPTVGLWPVTAFAPLARWLDDSRPAALHAFLDHLGYSAVEFEQAANAPGGDPFFNVNRPDDLVRSEASLTKL